MSITKREDGSLLVEEYTYMEYCQSIQTCIQAGYEFSFSNRDFPTHYASPFTAGFVPIDAEKRFPKEQPNTSTETAQTSDSSVINGVGGQTTLTESPETTKDAVNEPTEDSTEVLEVSSVSSAIKTPTKRGAKK